MIPADRRFNMAVHAPVLTSVLCCRSICHGTSCLWCGSVRGHCCLTSCSWRAQRRTLIPTSMSWGTQVTVVKTKVVAKHQRDDWCH